MDSVSAACSTHNRHVSFRWSIHIFRSLSYSTWILWLWFLLTISAWGESCLMYSDVIVLIPCLFFSRNTMYMGLIVSIIASFSTPVDLMLFCGPGKSLFPIFQNPYTCPITLHPCILVNIWKNKIKCYFLGKVDGFIEIPPTWFHGPNWMNQFQVVYIHHLGSPNWYNRKDIDIIPIFLPDQVFFPVPLSILVSRKPWFPLQRFSSLL